MKVNREFIEKISEIVLPELIELIPQLITGNLGIILPSIGSIYFEYRNKEKNDKIINDLKTQISNLTKEEQENIESSIRSVVNEMLSNIEYEYVELYLIDGFKVVLNHEENIIECLNALQDAWEENAYSLKSWVRGNIFTINNTIIFNLSDHQCREDLEELLISIKSIIENCIVGTSYGIIKKVIFF